MHHDMQVEFRDKQSTIYFNKNTYTCLLGNCGAQKESHALTVIPTESPGANKKH